MGSCWGTSFSLFVFYCVAGTNIRLYPRYFLVEPDKLTRESFAVLGIRPTNCLGLGRQAECCRGTWLDRQFVGRAAEPHFKISKWTFLNGIKTCWSRFISPQWSDVYRVSFDILFTAEEGPWQSFLSHNTRQFSSQEMGVRLFKRMFTDKVYTTRS